MNIFKTFHETVMLRIIKITTKHTKCAKKRFFKKIRAGREVPPGPVCFIID